MRLDEIPTPALLLDLDVLERNLERMATRAARLGVALRPHLKTHKCLEIAARQQELGARGFTVSTLAEAAHFAAAGFTDLTWAFPLIACRLLEVEEVAAVADLGLLVDSHAAVDALEARGRRFKTWLEVDCGDHRSGVDPASSHARELAERLHRSRSLDFAGLLTHAGHGYRVRGREALQRVAEEERRVMVDFAAALRGAGINVAAVSVGSTPTTSAARNLDGVDEARPGNYVFYDWTQCGLGAARPEDVAVRVLASVVSAQPGARHSVIDAGALSLSRDPGLEDAAPASFGRLDDDAGGVDPEVWVTALSQEHGIVNRRLEVGRRVRVLPNHSCLAVPHFEHYHVVRGERVVERWRILR